MDLKYKETISKNDAITLYELPELNSEIGQNKDYFIDDKAYTYLKRLPIIFYILDVKEDDGDIAIQIKRTKTSKANKDKALWFPIEIFKAVEVPRMNDIINWIYDGKYATNASDFPDNLRIFKSELEQISRYIIELFQYRPKHLTYLNSLLNHLYVSFNPIEILTFVKDYILWNRIPREHLFIKFLKQSKREKFISVAQSLDPLKSRDDVIAYWDLNRKLVFDIPYISNEERLDRYLYPNKIRLNNYQSKELDEQIDNILSKDSLNRIKNNSGFLGEISQEIIDDLELTIFNVTVLEQQNQYLFIFIDKYNNKRYYLEDFYYEFYLSKDYDILDNDYIEPLSPKHVKYSLTKCDHLKQLNYNINSNYKHFMKEGKF